MSAKTQHCLEIDSVELSFGDRSILSNVYLRVDTGRVTGLLGRNGTGKSCLMRILFDDLKAHFKSIRIDGQWQERLSHKQVLYLSQQSSVPNHLKVSDVFRHFGVGFDGFLLLFPDLAYIEKIRVGHLSGGERRLVELYTLLQAESQFLMLDEPFAQLMPLHISVIKQLILRQKEHKGILVTDHQYRNVLDVSDSIYVVHDQTLYATKSSGDLVKYGYIC